MEGLILDLMLLCCHVSVALHAWTRVTDHMLLQHESLFRSFDIFIREDLWI